MNIVNLRPHGSVSPTATNIADIARVLIQAEKIAIENLTLVTAGSVFPVELVLPGSPLYPFKDQAAKELLESVEPRPFAERVRDKIGRPAIRKILGEAREDSDSRHKEFERRADMMAEPAVATICRHYRFNREQVCGTPTGALAAMQNIYQEQCERILSSELQNRALELGNSSESAAPLFLEGRPLASPEAAYARVILRQMATDMYAAMDWFHHGSAEKNLRQHEEWGRQVREKGLRVSFSNRKHYLTIG